MAAIEGGPFWGEVVVAPPVLDGDALPAGALVDSAGKSRFATQLKSELSRRGGYVGGESA